MIKTNFMMKKKNKKNNKKIPKKYIKALGNIFFMNSPH